MNPQPMLSGSDEDLARAAQTLARGELLGLPTETVYGLAADALNPEAVRAIYRAKGRPSNHPLIVHLASADGVTTFADAVPAPAAAWMKAFWPGPLTLILKRRAGVAEEAAGGHPGIALRCPSHALTLKVLQLASDLGVKGVAAPSANVFGKVSPTTAQHVREAFAQITILDGGACDIGIESTIVDVTQDTPVLLRPGILGAAQLSAVAGIPVARASAQTRPATTAAPGNVASHYAPRAQLSLCSTQTLVQRSTDCPSSLAVWSRTPLTFPAHVHVRAMPAQADACAQALFAELRALDALGVTHIWVEAPPEGEAWDGIRDRLQRAAHTATTHTA